MAFSCKILAAAALLTLTACESLLFSDHVGCKDCDPGIPVEGTAGRVVQPTPEHSWVPLIESCMAHGGTRAECIDALPPNVLDEFEAWASQNETTRG